MADDLGNGVQCIPANDHTIHHGSAVVGIHSIAVKCTSMICRFLNAPGQAQSEPGDGRTEADRTGGHEIGHGSSRAYGSRPAPIGVAMSQAEAAGSLGVSERPSGAAIASGCGMIRTVSKRRLKAPLGAAKVARWREGAGSSYRQLWGSAKPFHEKKISWTSEAYNWLRLSLQDGRRPRTLAWGAPAQAAAPCPMA